MPIAINSRILLSAASIAAAAALIIGATFAFFSDTETSSGNTFTAGTLDLQVNGVDNPGTLVTLTAKPSESVDPVKVTLTNTGNNQGIADLHFVTVTDDGGTLTEPECVEEGGTWDPTFTPPCQGGGWSPINGISSQIGVDICYDLNGNGTVAGDECLIWVDDTNGVIEPGELSWGDNLNPNDVVASLVQLESVGFDLGDLLAGESRGLIISFHLDEDAGNQYQGDLSTFDIEFTLHQTNDDTTDNIVPVTPTPTPTPEP